MWSRGRNVGQIGQALCHFDTLLSQAVIWYQCCVHSLLCIIRIIGEDRQAKQQRVTVGDNQGE
jgi:hypothetical protein